MTNKARNKDRKERQDTRDDQRQARATSGSQSSRAQSGGSAQSSGRADDTVRSTDLRDSPMMARLMDAMGEGQDVGHFGRLVFAMVARFFLSDEEMLDLLSKQPDFDEKEARVMLAQVKERGYNPPKRERILQWQSQQDFQICPDTEDPNGCNVYRELQFPDEIYSNIEDFWEEKVEADQKQDE